MKSSKMLSIFAVFLIMLSIFSVYANASEICVTDSMEKADSVSQIDYPDYYYDGTVEQGGTVLPETGGTGLGYVFLGICVVAAFVIGILVAIALLVVFIVFIVKLINKK
ncbi:MAG: hypothetical protein IKU52_06365 [Clostridia bacterium]|nr:hypothetical protein [Clostridia bacterium]